MVDIWLVFGLCIDLRIPWVITHLENLITCVQLKQITWKMTLSEKLCVKLMIFQDVRSLIFLCITTYKFDCKPATEFCYSIMFVRNTI